MNESLIKDWNILVPKNGIVYHLGDLFFHSDLKKIDPILGRLNGKIRLIEGNHDRMWVKRLHKLSNSGKIEWIKPYHELKFNHQLIVLSHYPFHSWRNSHHGSIHLHGHCHGTLNEGAFNNPKHLRMDVGVDVGLSAYSPFYLEDVLVWAKDQKEDQ